MFRTFLVLGLLGSLLSESVQGQEAARSPARRHRASSW
jgi:hypothetical protein